ncbi:MAG: hypothetical protein ABFE16_16265 [Armatimonadia bacterium]
MACRALLVACCVVSMATVMLGGCSKAKEAATDLRNVGEAAKLAQGETARLQTENGVVEVQAQKQGEDQVTVKTTGPDGKQVTYQGGKQGDLSKLGIEIYPGAKQEQASTVSGGDTDVTQAQFTTSDAFGKVAQFYKDKYKDAALSEMSTGEHKTLTIQAGDEKDMKIIIVTQEEDLIKILLQHHAKKQ